MAKTPSYTKRAIENYRSKFYLQQLRLGKDVKERAEKVGLTPAKMSELITKEVERLEQEG